MNKKSETDHCLGRFVRERVNARQLLLMNDKSNLDDITRKKKTNCRLCSKLSAPLHPAKSFFFVPFSSLLHQFLCFRFEPGFGLILGRYFVSTNNIYVAVRTWRRRRRRRWHSHTKVNDFSFTNRTQSSTRRGMIRPLRKNTTK